ncbi:MAG: GGDEF domain-containing protein [Methylobacter sp.]|nr:MAG: GGDEF domain-containing protein [Methylobacter sp.]
MNKWQTFLPKNNKNPVILLIACLLVNIGIGVVDFKLGREFGFSIFYLMPIILVTLVLGRHVGLIFCIIATGTWFAVDQLSNTSYSHPMIGYWNAIMRLGFFVMITWLFPFLQELEREKQISRIDDLTGIANRRYFFELLQAELNRFQRYKHAFTIVYIDLDGFKLVNDKYGHMIGDRVLCAFVNRAKKLLRDTDIIGRLGGDEFIFLLPEMGQDDAKITVAKVQSGLLDEMNKNNWPVTFSIGVLSYKMGEISADELVKRADRLMYTVKNNSKNAIAYGVYPE